MKKIVLIVCSFFMFFSCTTTKGINDYDPISFEKKTYDESEILGKVTVSKLDWVWSSYYPDDSKTMKLFKRLEKKAKRKYGENIELVDISIGDNQSAITIPLYVAGGAGYLTGIVIAASSMATSESSDSTKNTEMNGMSAAGFGVAFGSLFSYFFKGVKATATVVKSNEPIEYVFSTEEEIKERRIESKFSQENLGYNKFSIDDDVEDYLIIKAKRNREYEIDIYGVSNTSEIVYGGSIFVDRENNYKGCPFEGDLEDYKFLYMKVLNDEDAIIKNLGEKHSDQYFEVR